MIKRCAKIVNGAIGGNERAGAGYYRFYSRRLRALAQEESNDFSHQARYGVYVTGRLYVHHMTPKMYLPSQNAPLPRPTYIKPRGELRVFPGVPTPAELEAQREGK